MKHHNIKIAMAVSGFPVVSQTFISLQIAELYKCGCDIKIINMGRVGDDDHVPESVKLIKDQLTIIALPYHNRASDLRNVFHFLFILVTNFLSCPIPSVKLFCDKALRLKLLDFARIHNDAFLLRMCEGSDIIHFQFATLADRFNHVNQYGFMHSTARLVCSIRGYDISRKTSIADIDWKFLFREFALFLPVCDYFVHILKKMGCKKAIKVIRSPVDVDALNSRKNAIRSGTINILSMGRLVEKKGFDDALGAISILHKSFTDFHYTIIGDGPLFNSLESRIRDYHLSDKVSLAGELPPERTLEIMAGSHILLAPSKTAVDGDSEGIPNVIKEAMILGLQVIATRHAGIPEVIENRVNGFMVSENSPEEIAEILDELIKDKSGWRVRSEKARTLICNEYTPGKTTRDLIKAYESIICQAGIETSKR